MATNSVGTAYGNEVSFRTSGCGLPVTVNHVTSGGVSPVNKTVTYGSVANVPGEPVKCWMTSNLGADQQAGIGSSTGNRVINSQAPIQRQMLRGTPQLMKTLTGKRSTIRVPLKSDPAGGYPPIQNGQMF
jgi:hypothetical protein